MLVACVTTGNAPNPVPTSPPVATKLVPTSVPPSPTTAGTPAAATNGTGAKVPGSCDAIMSLVDAYTGGVLTTKSLGTPQHLSCEFAEVDTTIIVIVNIGVGGTAAAFDALRTTSGQGGRTVTPIGGLGVSAFSVSKGNVPAGVAVLTAAGLVYDVNSNLPIAQDEALVRQLMALP
jgi:hypothetical protein